MTKRKTCGPAASVTVRLTVVNVSKLFVSGTATLPVRFTMAPLPLASRWNAEPGSRLATRNSMVYVPATATSTEYSTHSPATPSLMRYWPVVPAIGLRSTPLPAPVR